MRHYTKLKGKLFEMGITQKELQPIIDRGQVYITTRLNQHKPWTGEEITKLGEYLEIPREQWPDYFL